MLANNIMQQIRPIAQEEWMLEYFYEPIARHGHASNVGDASEACAGNNHVRYELQATTKLFAIVY